MRTGEVALKEVFVLDSAFSQPQVVIALDIRRVGRPACLLSAAGPWEQIRQQRAPPSIHSSDKYSTLDRADQPLDISNMNVVK